MEKNRGTKIIAIAALFIAVIGLSIGFAAFSSTLTISSGATYTPDQSVWKVGFGTAAATELAADNTTVAPALTANGLAYNAENDTNTTKFTATSGTITNGLTASNASTSTFTGLQANFTTPGQTATYTIAAVNAGELDAYLESVTFGDATGATNGEKKICKADVDTQGKALATDALVQAACEKISLKVTVGTVDYTTTSAVSPKVLLARRGGTTPVVVTIAYDATGDVRADGPFTVTFGDVSLGYTSVPNAD